VTTGIALTAIGISCYVIGVWYARRNTQEQILHPQPPAHLAAFREDIPFWIFCLLAGWLFTFGLTALRSMPTLGAVIINGGAIWMLGVLLGLRWSVRNKRRMWTAFWLFCLSIYPAIILVTVGFLSYGATAALIVLCGLTAVSRRQWRVFVVIALVGYLGLSLFANYFQARQTIRDAVYFGGTLQERVLAIGTIVTEWKFFTADDQIILIGFDLRLNQNYFVGLSAQKIDDGSVNYLYGRSVVDAFLALVPRVLWPGKTVFGGSPDIVMEMTQLRLTETTSWGVGQVMEFYINFGLPGLVLGFLSLGWAMGRLDHRAALAEATGDYPTAMLFFLPCVALVQPVGSMVELTGSAAAAWLGAYFWRWCWRHWQERRGIGSLARSDAA
jgi:hypothetical protein